MRIEEDIPMQVLSRSSGGHATLTMSVEVEDDADKNYKVRIRALLSTYGCQDSAHSIDEYQVFDLRFEKIDKASQYRPIVSLGTWHTYGCENSRPLGAGKYDNPLTPTDFEIISECFVIMRELANFIQDILVIGVESAYDLMKAVLAGIEATNERTREDAKIFKKSRK